VTGPTDNAGQHPEVGDYVAYNYSGQIATGWILSTGRGRWHTTYRIHQHFPREGHISHIRGGSKCVLVMEKGARA
jgi:hypothetical protein